MSKNTPEYKYTSINNTQFMNLLSRVLMSFADKMQSAYFKLVMVDDKNKVLQTYSNSQKADRLQLEEGQDWSPLIQNIYWDKKEVGQGVLNAGDSVFNIIKYDADLVLNQSFRIFLISSIDIEFPWLKIAISAIDTALRAELNDATMQKQMDDTHQYTFAIMNALKIGVIAVNEAGQILYANDHACVSVNIRRRDLIKIPIKQLIPNWNHIYTIIKTGDNFINEEIQIKTSTAHKYNVSISPILDQKNEHLIGCVIAMRELENVYNLVNKYMGMQARFTFADIIAKSQSMRKLIDYASTISNSPSTVLIEGESGTGKEVFAQSIHNASSRRESGFVAINCAAISDNLIESELFGYDDGAFTGAKKGGHPGKFELADKGTLFLDEIGDMKLEMQVKLLRAIQEGAITRVGGEKNISVDVRIIAATNKNLKEEVNKGRFRLDLFYRLSVIPLRIPALRDRKEDLPSLIRFFLSKKAMRLQKPIPQLSYTNLQKFLDYSWPGNIRELENAIEQYVNLEGKTSFDELKMDTSFWTPSSDLSQTFVETNADTLKLNSISEMEKDLILKTLNHFEYNMTQSALSLNISRNTLYLKLKKYHIRGV